jgi:hypothetical protein
MVFYNVHITSFLLKIFTSVCMIMVQFFIFKSSILHTPFLNYFCTNIEIKRAAFPFSHLINHT